jgi:hypothetical protein
VLAVIPIAGVVMSWELTLFGYNTSIRWDTFVTGQVVTAIVITGLQIGAIFLALAGIEAADAQALDWFRSEGRSRFGRVAVVAALTAISLVLIRKLALQLLTLAFPSAASVDGLDIPRSVLIPLPSLMGIGGAAIQALEASAAVALFMVAIREMPGRVWLRDAVPMAMIFFLTIDSSVTLRQMPLMLLSAATASLLAWCIVRFVLRENRLAYPLVFFWGSLLASAATLLSNHRFDLRANAVVEIAAVVAVAIWIARRPNREEHA